MPERHFKHEVCGTQKAAKSERIKETKGMRKAILIPILSFSFFFISYSSLFAEVMIIGIEIPNLHQIDGMGVYDQILMEKVPGSRFNVSVFALASYAAAGRFMGSAHLPANKRPVKLKMKLWKREYRMSNVPQQAD